MTMHEIQASVAKARLSQILDEVERGETFVITRHGRAIARIIPEAQRRQQEIKAALDSIKALGQEIAREHGPASIEEIVSSIHEGHKY
jgi:prevent-host-death family protein